MNKTIVIAILVLVVLGGGIFAVANMNKQAPIESTQTTTTPTQAMEINEEVSGTPSGAMMKAEGTVKEFTVEGSNFKFLPTEITVNEGDTVRVVFKNTAGLHDFVIDEFNAKTKQISGGNSETIEFVADKKGTYEYYCSVGKHREMGMKGTLTVN